MADHGMSEEAAFKFLQRRAMDTRATAQAVAEQVLARELAPD